jgi:colanic acid biosynthesis protein WcaH
MLINANSPAIDPLPWTSSGFLRNEMVSAARQQQSNRTDHTRSPAPLTQQAFAAVVENAPLISIDLIIVDAQGKLLLGLRNNPPAKGSWFVPGGRIRKNEPIGAAFSRIALDEVGQHLAISHAQFMGVYEHFYDTDFADTAGATTHYVVLAYKLKIDQSDLNLPRQQHSRYLWINTRHPQAYPDVHPNTQAYFPLIR